jgi:hypothetical protein
MKKFMMICKRSAGHSYDKNTTSLCTVYDNKSDAEYDCDFMEKRHGSLSKDIDAKHTKYEIVEVNYSQNSIFESKGL